MKPIKTHTKTTPVAPETAPAPEVDTKLPAESNHPQFTYIGAGEGSPQVINLMGKQKFVRGKLTEVTDPDILAKLPGMATFVQGPVDMEILHQIDSEAKEVADAQRAEDQQTNAKYNKKHRGE